MCEKLHISDFDIVGIIELKDVEGIENLVTQIGDEKPVKGKTKYLSRSKEYYNVKSLTELSKMREKLKEKLTSCLSKKNFVILEYMLNCSAKVYFKKFEEYILNNQDEKVKEQLDMAERCMLEDTSNILKILENQGLIQVNRNLILPEGKENCARRFIEMDNKAMLYTFGKSLENYNGNYEILNPGYGSIYIGPFLKQMYGYDFTNLLKSKYITETCGKTNIIDIEKLVSSSRMFDSNKRVMLLDDNIGTGSTIKEIKSALKDKGITDILSGAVQYNWRNYYRISIGEKKDIERFDVNEFEILTPINYAGHNLYSHAIDMLHSSGEEYIKYLNSKSYRKAEYNDLEGSVLRGLISAARTGLILNERYKNINMEKITENDFHAALTYDGNRNRNIKVEALAMVDTIINNIIKFTIDKNENSQDVSR